MFLPNQVEIVDFIVAANHTNTKTKTFEFVKVRPNGKSVRRYCECCGTRLGVVTTSFWALNRNAIYNSNGNTKYIPQKPPINSIKRFSFEPDQVPNSSVNIGQWKDVCTLLKTLFNPFGPAAPTAIMELLFNTTVKETDADEVPITWE
mmetsp:Transcript_30706/g.46520  ORF Transcript_30706/g.46520 Transcript_30706/m.46520 type:complete len:148 (-) Transcript_30706:2152-2595(-)